MTLVEFLTARIDEDEQLARGVEQSVGSERKGEPYSDGSGIAAGDAFPSYPWGALPEELPFMAGPGHPARVLAEVAAKRAILAAHLAAGDNPSGEMRDFGYEEGLEEAIRLLALSYADHPDYDPAWRT